MIGEDNGGGSGDGDDDDDDDSFSFLFYTWFLNFFLLNFVHFPFCILVGASEDIYGTDESKCQSKQMRKNAFKGNEYEKEVRIERIRRMRREKEKSMEEEAKRRHEEEARLEEAKLKEGSQKSTRQEETDQKQVKEAYQENATQIKGMHKILPPLDAVREPTAAIGARSASPMERRIPCQTCEDHNVTPFQVVKYKKMKEVLEKCTRYSDVKGDQKYDYLCLSGTLIWFF